MAKPHTVLGVDAAASLDEVRAAWRALSSKHHPDRGGDAEQFVRIKLAYEQMSAKLTQLGHFSEIFDDFSHEFKSAM